MRTRQLVLTAIFIALSVVGAQFSLFNSIALDSMPAFLAANLLSPMAGAFVGFFGHLFTSIRSGFPLSIPVHLITAITMAITMYVFGLARQKYPDYKGIAISWIVAFLFNVGIGLLAVSPIIGVQIAISLIIPLTLGTLVNVTCAELVYQSLPKTSLYAS